MQDEITFEEIMAFMDFINAIDRLLRYSEFDEGPIGRFKSLRFAA